MLNNRLTESIRTKIPLDEKSHDWIILEAFNFSQVKIVDETKSNFISTLITVSPVYRTGYRKWKSTRNKRNMGTKNVSKLFFIPTQETRWQKNEGRRKKHGDKRESSKFGQCHINPEYNPIRNNPEWEYASRMDR